MDGRKAKDRVIFTLTKKGETKPTIQSQAFQIQTITGEPDIHFFTAEEGRNMMKELQTLAAQHAR